MLNSAGLANFSEFFIWFNAMDFLNHFFELWSMFCLSWSEIIICKLKAQADYGRMGVNLVHTISVYGFSVDINESKKGMLIIKRDIFFLLNANG